MRASIRDTVAGTDHRGFFARLTDTAVLESASNIHLVSLEPDSVRGNHFHKNQTEYVWVIGGPVRFVAVDNETGERIDTVFDGNGAPFITLPPRISHAFKNIGAGTNYLLCFSHLASGTWRGDVERNVILE